MSFQLAHGDASRLRLRPAPVDLVVTDPPYESLEKHRAISTTRLKHGKASSNDWFGSSPTAATPSCSTKFYRVLARTRTSTCTDPGRCSSPPLAETPASSSEAADLGQRRIGMGYHYRARYECILFFEGQAAAQRSRRRRHPRAPRVIGGYPPRSRRR
jgi:site-specific DNA-methyltransferase (adenine-specific)